ncbi:unnamed protein product [Rotaria sp. Silwood2]|nr:unnamed protein product [Rotaria sp. Silwood2]CAF2816867.1 unnamed protein product [Rotaria sp. Silwood2]CAF3083681.1 unnamed protein product [Rotaria sp. Silwood2]CAF3234854.1 unnamed protein product [Rotaria sp. Silwood2]CAF3889029.1 unnamed protein product [Rotaria sp. Silwood2]
MQTKTLLALFCTIIVLLVRVNDGAPAAPKPVAAKEESSKIKQIPPTLSGARTPWKTSIDAKSKKLFNDNKPTIKKKLQSIHKVPTTFNPKPSKVATQVVNGILYHYLVKLPTNKYAYVTVLNRPWNKSNKLANEEHVIVRPELHGLNDKNI